MRNESSTWMRNPDSVYQRLSRDINVQVLYDWQKSRVKLFCTGRNITEFQINYRGQYEFRKNKSRPLLCCLHNSYLTSFMIFIGYPDFEYAFDRIGFD